MSCTSGTAGKPECSSSQSFSASSPRWPTSPAAWCWFALAAWSAICAISSRSAPGFLMATALLEMTPESLRMSPALGPVLIMAGYCVVHLLEHTINAHFHYGEETHHDEFVSARTGYAVLGGLSVHALFDGVAIGSGFVVNNALGWLIFLAVFLHKAPEGFTMASVMLASGRSRTAAFYSAVALAAATVAGVAGHRDGSEAGCPMDCRSRRESRFTLAQATWYPRSIASRAFAWRWCSFSASPGFCFCAPCCRRCSSSRWSSTHAAMKLRHESGTRLFMLDACSSSPLPGDPATRRA